MSDQKNNGPEGQNDNQSQRDRDQTNSTGSAGSSITKLLEFLLSLPGATQISEMVARNLLPISISSLVGIGIGGGRFLPLAMDSGQQKKPDTTTSSPTPDKPPSVMYNERKIDMNEVCEDPKSYPLDPKTINNPTFTPGKSVQINNDGEKIWPVYSSQCKYTVLDKPGKDIRTGSIGLDLNEFCQRKYPSKKYHAGYHNYDDPHSWYCVNPNPL